LICGLIPTISGLKINFHKNEIYCLGAAKEKAQYYSEIFTFPVADLPMKYLGMPIDEKKLAVGACGREFWQEDCWMEREYAIHWR
jgi:hypothetical protein